MRKIQQLVKEWDESGRNVSLYRLAKDNGIQTPSVYNARNALIAKGLIKNDNRTEVS